MNKSIVVDVIRFLLIILLVYAAVSKLLDVERFREHIEESSPLPDTSHWVAWGLPLVELILAVMLVFRKTRLYGLTGATALMLFFTLYIASILLFRTSIPCSCGGIVENITWSEHLILNIFFFALAFTGTTLCQSLHGAYHKTSIAIGSGVRRKPETE